MSVNLFPFASVPVSLQRSFLWWQWWRVRSFSMPSAFTCTRSKLQAGSSFPLRFANALRTNGCRSKSGSTRGGGGPGRLSPCCPFHRRSGSDDGGDPAHRQRCLHGGRASPNRRCPAGRDLAHLYSAAFFRCHSTNYRPSGSGHSCPCHGDHSLLTRGGNRVDDIRRGTLGTRSALEFVYTRRKSRVAVRKAGLKAPMLP